MMKIFDSIKKKTVNVPHGCLQNQSDVAKKLIQTQGEKVKLFDPATCRQKCKTTSPTLSPSGPPTFQEGGGECENLLLFSS
jgi:hypothetical protein